MTSRKAVVEEEEDANKLQFGHDFQDSESISISDANFLLDFVRQRRAEIPESQWPEILVKTMKHLTDHAKFTSRTALTDAKRLFANKCTNYEINQIVSLCPETAEEAKALIPSIVDKYDDFDLDSLLKDFHEIRKFQMA